MMNQSSQVKNIFDIAQRAMNAQMTRMNTIASNLANANTVASSEEEAFRPMRPIFETKFSENFGKDGVATTDVVEIVGLERRAERKYAPDHPKADEDGFVYASAVMPEEEMVDMLEASRQYQNNVEVVTTLRALMVRTLSMGK
jgi:flagellar basal-body rod protein FlgC